ncbi:MAG: hypothetical protein CL693_21000 [Cellvibrionaceae bacterium]|nr:hypothetical protein [Cellvibrionaceae bacterium]|tara:strand:+ start:18541 stop:20859 length:2319 start_codon:yes stop_codon:yes gene_type:complete
MNEFHSIALVIGLCSHGLAMCRALRDHDVEVHAFEAKAFLPGVKTNSATIHYVRDINSTGLIDDLLAFRKTIDPNTRIVLLPTNDNNVKVIAQNYDKLESHFLLSWSKSRDSVLKLLLKSNIERRCREQGIHYPKSMIINSRSDVDATINIFEFPVLIKPVKPQSGFKALYCENLDTLKTNIKKYESDLPILAQDWISGTDKDLYFGALYLNDGEIISSICGNKLESHPPAMGQTTVAVTTDNPEVLNITKSFFDGLNLSGPVSLELKKDSDGRYWVIEPTVGRTDFWVGLCIAANVNLVYDEYLYSRGFTKPRTSRSRNAIWIDTEKDIIALFRYIKYYGKFWRAGHKPSFSYFSIKDIYPSIVSKKSVIARVPRYLRKRLLDKSDSVTTELTSPDDMMIRSFSDFDKLPTDCKDHLFQHSKNSIFSYGTWYNNFCRTVALECGSVRFMCLYKDSKIAAILPVWRKTERINGFNVTSISGLGNYYTPIFNMTFDESIIEEIDAGRQFLQTIINTNHWDRINLSPMPEEIITKWKTISSISGLSSFRYYVTKNMYEESIPDFSTYMDRRPSRLKNTIKRKSKKLDKLGDWSIKILDNPDDLDKSLESYHIVYNQSWKKLEPYPAFINGLARLAMDSNWLRLGILYLESNPIAVQLWLVRDETAYIYKLAYDDAYKNYSPGTILTHKLMEHVVSRDAVSKVDFLTGDEAFKLDWMSSSRNLEGIQIVNRRTLVGLGLYLRNVASELKKKLLTVKNGPKRVLIPDRESASGKAQ